MKARAEKSSEDSAHYFAKNLLNLMEKRHLTINQLAQALGLPLMTIRRLVSGETTDPRISTLKLIANYFDVPVDVLFSTKMSLSDSQRQVKPQFVPLLDWETAEKISSISELELNNWQNWQSVTTDNHSNLSENSFALESRPSMHPRFPQGSVFIIDPDASPTDGDIVLVRIKENSELTLRILNIDPPNWILQSLVSAGDVLKYSADLFAIEGVNILTMLYNRR